MKTLRAVLTVGRRPGRPGAPGAMGRSTAPMTAALAAAALLAAGIPLRGQDSLTAALDPSGMVRVQRAGEELATIELNAHGPDWQHAPQKTASAQTEALPEGGGWRIRGSLPIPGTEGGAIRYTETLQPLPKGLRVVYDLTMARAMKLNGLQFSVNLPAERYAGKEVLVSRLDGEPELVGLPKEHEGNRFQLSYVQGSRVEAAKDTPDALTVELLAATDVVVQDLRQWENPVFEIRCPAIMENEGRGVSEGDTFHLEVTVTFSAPVRFETR